MSKCEVVKVFIQKKDDEVFFRFLFFPFILLASECQPCAKPNSSLYHHLGLLALT